MGSGDATITPGPTPHNDWIVAIASGVTGAVAPKSLWSKLVIATSGSRRIPMIALESLRAGLDQPDEAVETGEGGPGRRV